MHNIRTINNNECSAQCPSLKKTDKGTFICTRFDRPIYTTDMEGIYFDYKVYERLEQCKKQVGDTL